MKRMPRLVGHDPDVPLINRITAEVHVKFHFLLQHHHQLASIVVRAEKFVAIVQSIDVLPPVTCERFEERRTAYVIEYRFLIERVAEIEGRFDVRVWRLLILWK